MDELILLSVAVLFLLRMPVAYAFGLSALIGAWWIDIPFEAVDDSGRGQCQQILIAGDSFLCAGGAIMADGGMSRRLVAFAAVLVGFVRGGLSLVNIMASTFLGAISG